MLGAVGFTSRISALEISTIRGPSYLGPIAAVGFRKLYVDPRYVSCGEEENAGEE